MVVSAAPRTDTRESRGLFAVWNDPRWRSIIYQILVLALVILGGWYLVSNLNYNLRTRNIQTGFSFLDREAGFPISQSVLSYTPANTFGWAFVVGLVNTLLVAALGIVFATILGVVAGIARLSSNWLVARLATVYIEALRNVPLLLQLFFWYAMISQALPAVRNSFNPLPGVFLNQRGLRIPVPTADPAWGYMGIALLVGLVAAWVLRRWARRRQEQTGRPFPAFLLSFPLVLLPPLAVWLAFGAPVDFEVPELRGFNFQGGTNVSPELTALTFGLSVYTATFIAEIVRAGILAVSHGQTEAASALGLRRGLVLRLVVLPQALRIIIPPTTSQYLNLTKNSSLAVAIGYPDLVMIGNITMNQTGQAIEAISIFMAVYLVISLAISLGMNLYNRRIALVER